MPQTQKGKSTSCIGPQIPRITSEPTHDLGFQCCLNASCSVVGSAFLSHDTSEQSSKTWPQGSFLVLNFHQKFLTSCSFRSRSLCFCQLHDLCRCVSRGSNMIRSWSSHQSPVRALTGVSRSHPLCSCPPGWLRELNPCPSPQTQGQSTQVEGPHD